MEWDRAILTQQLEIRDFSLGESLLVHGHHTYTHTGKHKLQFMCVHALSHINKHMHQHPFSFPGYVSRGISSTSRSAEVTSSPCPALRISQQDITNFSGPILAVGHPFCPGHQFKRTRTEAICRGGFQGILVASIFWSATC